MRTIGQVVNEKVGGYLGEHMTDVIDYFFGEGTADSLTQGIVDGANWLGDKLDWVDDKVWDGMGWIFDTVSDLWNDDDDDDGDYKEITTQPPMNLLDILANDVNEVLDDYDMDNWFERLIAQSKLDKIFDSFNSMFSGLFDFISSITLQIRGFLMNFINFSVDIEHVDISAEMDESLKVLTKQTQLTPWLNW